VNGEVLDRRPDGAVLIRTRIGDILGTWANDKHPVRVGHLYSFEFGFDLVLTSAHRAAPGAADDAAAGVTGDSTQVRGCIESIDDNGQGYLRLAQDSLSMIDTDGSLGQGTTVSFTTSWTGLVLWSIGMSLTSSEPGSP
jgi:hypothetical protein